MLIDITLLAIGIMILILGSNYFVDGAASIAKNMKIPIIVIGLTIVAFATSAPEILVSLVAALDGESDLAIGNAIGSNTANIGLVLGTMALIRPVQMSSKVYKKLITLLLLVSLIMILPFIDNAISVNEGRLILGGFILVMIWLVRFSLKLSNENIEQDDFKKNNYKTFATKKALTLLIIGLVLLFIGADMIVRNAIKIAHTLEISETVIGITLVAIGTSLPELSVSITSALKKEYGLAVGNIIGSNIFNLLAVIGAATAISPSKLPDNILSVHYLIMLSLTLSIFVIAYRKNKVIKRFEGFSLLTIYCFYIVFIIS
ncbi:MAG: cation:H+ antiporter [Woeseiaceae bacterium]|jgi:cation:H+ antiporter|tara:strand:+ start:11145 stop:12095 length:951 start_codon:yes stop_codon:yes gene_type:complete